ncbi:MAG TPA: energy transducer TonB [Tenuifilaceae bacterium]|nr:energy transducer TonB [Tenuifilaceae bacterium]
MEGNTNIHHSSSDCITQDVLIKYIRGQLDGKTMNRIERHISVCPMCADELEGIQHLQNPEEIHSIVEDINSRIDSNVKRGDRRIRVYYISRIAAIFVVLLAVSVLILYFLNINRSDSFLSDNAELELAKEETPKEVMNLPHDEVLNEEKIAKEKRLEKEAIPKPPPPPSETVEIYSIVDDDVEVDEISDDIDLIFEEPAMEADKAVSPPVSHQEENAVAGGAAQQQPVPIASKGVESSKREKQSVDKVVNLFDSEVDTLQIKSSEQDFYMPISFAEEEEEVEEEEVFVMVEQMPQFFDKNGDDFNTYLLKNRRYPEEASEKGIQGKVFVEFYVERDGSVTNVKVVRGVDPSLDKEATRLIESCPRWKPGMQRGKPVRVKMSVPITFEIH